MFSAREAAGGKFKKKILIFGQFFNFLANFLGVSGETGLGFELAVKFCTGRFFFQLISSNFRKI